MLSLQGFFYFAYTRCVPKVFVIWLMAPFEVIPILLKNIFQSVLPLPEAVQDASFWRTFSELVSFVSIVSVSSNRWSLNGIVSLGNS